MTGSMKYYVVSDAAMPEVLKKTVEAKRLLASGEARNVNEAIEKVGISRSAFYKYRELVSPLIDAAMDKIVTLQATLYDAAGVLSGLLNLLAEFHVNILTINQTIPVNGCATITISVRTGSINGDMEALVLKASELKGVQKIEVLASE